MAPRGAVPDAGPMLEPHADGRRYRIVVTGRLTPRFAAAFDGLVVEEDGPPGRTGLVGRFADQAALHGMLDRLWALGIELEELRALD